ncbi:MAG: hypothetical protein WC389_08010 [Lutibacter sp.]|jgi:hypothetical protein
MSINEESWKIGFIGNGIIRIEHEQNGLPYIGNVRYSQNPLATKDIAMKRAAIIAVAPKLLEAAKAVLENCHNAIDCLDGNKPFDAEIFINNSKLELQAVIAAAESEE